MDSHRDPRHTSRMHQSSIAVLILVLGLAVTPVRAAGEADVQTAQIAEQGSDISWGHAVAVIDQPIEDIVSVVVDYGNYALFMPNFTKSKVLAQRGNGAMVYMEVSVASGTLTLWGQLKFYEAAPEGDTRVIEVRLLEGNMEAFSASWRLTPIGDGNQTQVDFKIYVDPDMPLPSSVFSRENEKAAGKTVRALRTRVTKTSKRS